MRTIKKMALAAAAAAMLVMAVPAMASAVVLERADSPGVPLKAGHVIDTVEGYGMTLSNTGLGSFYCAQTKTDLSSEVILNEEGTVELEHLKSGTGTECDGNRTMENIRLDSLNTSEPGVGTVSVSLRINLGWGGWCDFSGAGSFSYEPGTNVIHLANFPVNGTSPICKGTGSSKFSGNFHFSMKGVDVLFQE